MHLPVQANDGIGFGMQPGYWRTWITGVNWHSSARMTETNPASRNVMTSKSGKMLKLLLLWFLLAVVVCLDVDVWCVKDDDIFSARCLLSCVCRLHSRSTRSNDFQMPDSRSVKYSRWVPVPIPDMCRRFFLLPPPPPSPPSSLHLF